jgi:hypothetical protein
VHAVAQHRCRPAEPAEAAEAVRCRRQGGKLHHQSRRNQSRPGGPRRPARARRHANNAIVQSRRGIFIRTRDETRSESGLWKAIEPARPAVPRLASIQFPAGDHSAPHTTLSSPPSVHIPLSLFPGSRPSRRRPGPRRRAHASCAASPVGDRERRSIIARISYCCQGYEMINEAIMTGLRICTGHPPCTFWSTAPERHGTQLTRFYIASPHTARRTRACARAVHPHAHRPDHPSAPTDH